MYLTLLNNLLELILDIGSRGFTFILYINKFCIVSVDSSYREIVIIAIAILIMKGELCKSISHFIRSLFVH